MKYFEKHPMLMIAIGVIGISLSSIFVRLSQAPSAVTAAYRLLWTVLLLTPAALGNRQNREELKNAPPKLIVLSVLSGLFLAIHFFLWFESLQHTSVASSTTIVCTEVIWVCLGFCLFLKGRISKKAAAAIAVTLLGSVLIALADSGEGEGHLEGDILAVLAAVCSAVYMLFGRSAQKKLSTTVYTYLVYGSCALVLVVICLIQGNGLLASGMNPVVVGAALALFSTILGHTIFSWALKFYSPSFVSACKLLEPVGAGILAVFLFGEIPAPVALLGAVLILAGVWYYSRIEKKA